MLAAQVTQAPTPLEALRPGVPPQLVADRSRSVWPSGPPTAGRARPSCSPQLERVRSTAEAATTRPHPRTIAVRRPRRARCSPGAAAGVAALRLAAVAVLLLRAAREAELRFGARSPLTVEPGLEIDPAMSPDGQLVAYAAGPLTASRLYVRQVDGGRPIAIAGDLAGAQRLPYWSPDNKRLVFRSARGIEVAPALGGRSKTLVPLQGGEVLLPGPWSPDGRRIAFARSDSLYVIPADGGAAGAARPWRRPALVRLVARRTLDRAGAGQPAIGRLRRPLVLRQPRPERRVARPGPARRRRAHPRHRRSLVPREPGLAAGRTGAAPALERRRRARRSIRSRSTAPARRADRGDSRPGSTPSQ